MTTPTLPQRTPGEALAALAGPAPQNCHACANRQPCDYHWAPKHRAAAECGCCFGRYSSCRNHDIRRNT